MELTGRAASLLVLTLLSLILGISSVPTFIESTRNNMQVATSVYTEQNPDVNVVIRGKSFPVITAINQRITLNATFDPMEWIEVTDIQDGDITSSANVYGSVDNTRKGTYELRYSVRNSFGLKTDMKIRVIVD